MTDHDKIVRLENKIKTLEFQQNQLIKVVLHSRPEWAQESLRAAKSAGLVELSFMGISSDGSYDFYRILDLLYRLKLLQ
ncbi:MULTISPECIES: hypothetical protein [Enterococcus]|uniref:hypothetical protein n=1 Tax=Enterococcus TaxID=1350 RepID=UPI0011651B3D|nr:hypothetical protein [Enterococcus avium]HAP3021222.1 hypothetical protein [Enterococcus faecalis]AYQ24202.1 hypothetical protein AUF16_06185 [Enterococcus avium]HBI1562052.1 hypothetical protein [Enterococcus faecalis]HBI1565111.1 hypothetical protein [Enterococcus faecalis]HBI1717423.1 hypothetical protein [Enterococcus faecalis]